ncbi:MAG: DUF4013 domain-containing protein [Candidatus Coatesbacteria bacterium]|nr:DUF4013 domain-containing protein [Candidatus Coatesbacteria bacterium]
MQKTSVTEALTGVLGEKHWMRKTLLGGLLLGIPVLFFFSKGYFLQILRTTIRDKQYSGLPEWRVGGSFLLGVKAFFISIIYCILPGLFFWLASLNQENAAWGTFLTIGVVLTVVAAVLLPWGIANWLSTDSVKSAFDVRRLLRIFGFLGEYLDVFLRCFLLLLFSVGTVFAAFFVAMACMRLFGEVAGRYLTPGTVAHS